MFIKSCKNNNNTNNDKYYERDNNNNKHILVVISHFRKKIYRRLDNISNSVIQFNFYSLGDTNKVELRLRISTDGEKKNTKKNVCA